MSVEQITDPTFLLRDKQSSYVKILGVSMRMLLFNYRNGMNNVTSLAICKPKDSSMQDAVEEQDGRKVVKKAFKHIL